MTSSRRGLNGLLATVAVTSVVASGALLFGAVDDTLVPGESSPLVNEFVRTVDAEGPDTNAVTGRPPAEVFGNPQGTASSLVLFEDGSAYSEVEAIAAANLASHFGRVQVKPVSQYAPGSIGQYTGVVYVGEGLSNHLSPQFVNDIETTDTKVMWVGAGVESLYGDGIFVEIFGWEPAGEGKAPRDDVRVVTYKGKNFERSSSASSMRVPEIRDPQAVEVLGSGLCGSITQPVVCPGSGPEGVPWAVRSRNLTYVSDFPFAGIGENTHAIAFADLFYDLLAPDTPAAHKAAVRLEDVGPMADPQQLRKVADLLHARGIPFQIAVIPYYISARYSDRTDDRFVGISLLDKPEVVSAIKYMQERGGQVVQHGTTHQLASRENPYVNSRSGEDFEFVRAQCSSEPYKPYKFEECEKDSWVVLTGPVGNDTVDEQERRVRAGRDLLVKAGLGEPIGFEVPHYGATPNAYEAIRRVYDTRYEAGTYYGGYVSGSPMSLDKSIVQIFPYTVFDIYGSRVLPENLGNVSLEEINNHPPRSPEDIVASADRNLAVRESTASFFFHPFLDPALLEQTVDGIQGLGYEFVPATQL